MEASANLYEKDFYAWTQEQAGLVKSGAFNKLDITHLYEEIEDMGNRHADEIESRLAVLLMHLLKWEYQPGHKTKSWYTTIVEQRSRINLRLKKMPSLKTKLPDLFIDAYEMAVKDACAETGMIRGVFPDQSKWSLNQVLDEDFFPN